MTTRIDKPIKIEGVAGHEREGYSPDADGAVAFRDMIAALSTRIDVDLDPSSGFVALRLNEVEVMLAHGETWGADNVRISCDVGLVPTKRRAAVYEAALISNGESDGIWSPVFSLEPESGHLSMTCALPMAVLYPEVLMTLLEGYVQVVDSWRGDDLASDAEDGAA